MEQREEFVNRTQGWVGYIGIDRTGQDKPGVVEPGGRVFLSPEEQELTARAHRRAEDSPFVVRDIVIFDPMTHEVTDQFRAPLLEKVEREKAARRKAPAEATA